MNYPFGVKPSNFDDYSGLESGEARDVLSGRPVCVNGFEFDAFVDVEFVRRGSDIEIVGMDIRKVSVLVTNEDSQEGFLLDQSKLNRIWMDAIEKEASIRALDMAVSTDKVRWEPIEDEE